MSIAYPEFQAARCTRYRYRYSQCARCAEACPHEAISLSDAGAALDQNSCRNCGLCLTACLTGAWSGAAYKPIELLRQVIKAPSASFACAPSGLPADTVVPCLGVLDGDVLAYLARRRMPVTLHGSGHCTECAHGSRGAAQLASNLEARELLRAAAGDESWAGVELPADEAAPARTFSSPRRQLFRRLLGRGVDEVAQAAEGPASPPAAIADKAIRAGPYCRSEPRELLQIVCERKDDRPFPVTWHEALPLMQLTLKPGCTACAACFRVCPTGALSIRENPGDWALVFQADHCVGCQVCLEVCQPGALDAEAAFDARPGQPDRVLHRLAKQRCERCDRFFVSPEPAATCGVCRDDEDAFSAIFG